MRALPCVVVGKITPTVLGLSFTLLSGWPGFQWLNALNASNRNSNPNASLMGKRLDSDRSALIWPGRRAALRAESPKYPGAG